MTLIRAVLAVSLGFAAVPQDSWALQPALKIGEKTTFKNHLEGKQADGKALAMDRVIEREVISVEEDGTHKVRLTGKSALIRIGAEEFRSERENVSVYAQGKQGELLRIEQGPSDVEAYRLAHITRFVSPPSPVKKGDSWRFEKPAGRPEGYPGSTIRFVLEGMESAGDKMLARVSFSYTEKGANPCTASGEWLIDTGTTLPEKMTADLENFSTNVPGKAKLSVERVK